MMSIAPKKHCLTLRLLQLALVIGLVMATPGGSRALAAAGTLTSDQTHTRLFSISEAIALALQSNRDYLNAVQEVRQRQITITAAEADFDIKIAPSSSAGLSDSQKTIGAGLRLEKKFKTGLRVLSSPQWNRTDDSYDSQLGLSLEVPLFRGRGRMVSLNAVDGARFSLRTTERTLVTRRNNLIVDTVAAFYGIVKQRELVRLSEHQVQQMSSYAVSARVRERVGLASPIDIYRAEIQLKDAQNTLASNRQSLREADDRLKLILALPLNTPLAVDTAIDIKPVRIDPAQAVTIALENRIELDQARDDIAEAQRRSDLAEHNLKPQLDLVMGYERFGETDSFDRSFDYDEDRWSIRLVSTTDWARSAETENAIAKTVIKAPFAGIAVLYEAFRDGQKRKPRVGDQVWQNQPLLYLPDISAMIVKTRIREIDLHKIRLEQPCRVKIDAYPDTRFEGRVSFIGVMASQRPAEGGSEKYFQLVIAIQKPDMRLRPGMTARITIQTDEVRNALTAPIQAVFDSGSDGRDSSDSARFCYRYLGSGQGFDRARVQVGRQNEDWVEILSGLKEGDRISLLAPEIETGRAP